MVDDVRVALIKLAERTCAIRAVKNTDDEKRNRVAREVFDIYAPLAHRLGIGHIKWELEDLSFRYLEPDQYKQIATLLHEVPGWEVADNVLARTFTLPDYRATIAFVNAVATLAEPTIRKRAIWVRREDIDPTSGSG